MGIENFKNDLAILEQQSLLRKLPLEETTYKLDFCSNDYLSLAADEALRAEFYKYHDVPKLSFSSSSSRLLCSNSQIYVDFEKSLANAYGKEACLLFNSGYHTNVGVVSALAQKGNLIVADKLVHASIIDGMRLSEADFQRFRHLNSDHLEAILEREKNSYETIIVITESIFSMDGDIADLKKLVALKKKYNFILYVDEAHALGSKGEKGLGICEELGLIQDVDILVGTFGKAMASYGAFVVCNEVLKKFFINKSRSLIYSTAIPPINVAWTHFIFSELPNFSSKRANLKKKSALVADALNLNIETNIIPYMVGESSKSVEIADTLRLKNYSILPIRYPTVAKNSARLRLSICEQMELNELLNFTEILKSL